MKTLLAVVGAGVVAVAMLTQPADAAPRCAWQGTYWKCWNGHSWYRDHHRDRAEFRHEGRWRDRDMHTGNTVEFGRHHGMRHDRDDWRYGR
jgi:hypothetical protein